MLRIVVAALLGAAIGGAIGIAITVVIVSPMLDSNPDSFGLILLFVIPPPLILFGGAIGIDLARKTR